MAIKFNPQQRDILEWVLTGDGNLMVQAGAGTGKSSTLKGLLPYLMGDVVYMAFNKSVQVEIQNDVSLMTLDTCNVDVKTVHALGLAPLPREWKGREHIDDRKVQYLLEDMAVADDTVTNRFMSPYNEYRDFLKKLVGYAKQSGGSVLWNTDEDEPWLDLIDHYSVDDDLPIKATPSYGSDPVSVPRKKKKNGDSDDPTETLSPYDQLIAKLLPLAREVFHKSLSMCPNKIDFNDMMIAALHYGFKFKKYDWVLFDEVQDSSDIRQELACQSLKPGGRMICVGDRLQCQPAGTQVWVCKSKGNRKDNQILESVNIEDIQEGETVISYNLSDAAFILQRNVLGRASRPFHGDLIVADMGGGYKSKYTPEHICVASYKSLEDKYVTYLMRKNGRYRVGMAPMCYANVGLNGPTARMRSEEADAVWVLSVHDDQKSARMEEAVISANYGIPQLMFTPKNGSSWETGDYQKVWERINPNEDLAVVCLSHYGRLLEFPFAAEGGRNTIKTLRVSKYVRKNPDTELNGVRRMSLVRACNLLDGCLMMKYTGTIHPGAEKSRSVVSISRERYDGLVYSLSVDGENLYVADGIVTHNCIYGFTGCRHDAMDTLKQRLKAHELPLMINYRCPKVVIAMAQQYAPDLKAHDGAPEGVYRQVYMEANEAARPGIPCFWDEVHTLGKDDVILCRMNRPIIELAYRLLRMQIPCKIEGRDAATSMIRLCQKWRIKTLVELEKKLGEYKEREMAKWMAKKNEERAAGIEDKVDTIMALIDAVRKNGKHDIVDLVDMIQRMFGDTKEGEKPSCLTLSTIFKWKGKESERVYLLGRTKYRSKWVRKPWEVQVEDTNLPYVAITRARKELVDIIVEG